MGILPKLYDIIEKTYIETLNDLENELYKLHENIKSEIIAIIGTQDEFKGEALISSIDDKNLINMVSTRIREKLPELEDPLREKFYNQLIVNFQNLLLFFRPVLRNIGILAIVHQKEDIKPIKTWLKEKANILEILFKDKL
ncbi:MAG: hypothetical protein ACFFAH_06420 [Promethearchaeota archaeon]